MREVGGADGEPGDDQHIAEVGADGGERNDPPAQLHQEVAVLVLNGVAGFVGGDGHGADAGLAIDRLGEVDDVLARVVVVGQAALDRLDRHFLQILAVEDPAGGFLAGDVRAVGDLAALPEFPAEPEVAEDGEQDARNHPEEIVVAADQTVEHSGRTPSGRGKGVSPRTAPCVCHQSI